MNITKLKSGKYRIRQMKDGKSYSLTIDYKPTKREASNLMLQNMSEKPKFAVLDTFRHYIDKYVTAKENVLSPSTIRLYRGYKVCFGKAFLDRQLDEITGDDIQREINRIAKNHSPKHTSNIHGFISAIMRMYRPDFVWHITLPQPKKTEYYIPTPDEVKNVIEQARGTEYEIAIRLGCYGLRRSEMLCVTKDSLDGNLLHIRQAKVINEQGKYVRKTTKTTFSERDIFIDDDLAEMIRKKGVAYSYTPNALIDFLHRCQDRANVPRFRYHDLRHFFATELIRSNLVSNGILAEKDIAYLGGWSKSGNTMQRIYTHARADKNDELKRLAQQEITHILR